MSTEKMTIIEHGHEHAVYKFEQKRFGKSRFASSHQFIGSYEDCRKYIEETGAEFVEPKSKEAH